VSGSVAPWARGAASAPDIFDPTSRNLRSPGTPPSSHLRTPEHA
jgi:hypothetical protein